MAGIANGLVRISVGLRNAGELFPDLEQALHKSGADAWRDQTDLRRRQRS